MGATTSFGKNVMILGIEGSGKTRFFYSSKQLPFSTDPPPT